MSHINTFSTFDCDLAAFLMLQGLKFIECKLENTTAEKPRVVMWFFDEKYVARDLERVFMTSEINRFSSCKKFLLKEIHRTLRGAK